MKENNQLKMKENNSFFLIVLVIGYLLYHFFKVEKPITDPILLNQQGLLSMNLQGAYKNAVDEFDRAIALKPDFADAFYNRGRAKYKCVSCKGDRFDAIYDLEKAIQLNPNFAEAYYHRGLIICDYGKEGCEKQKIADFDKAIQLKPDFADAYFERGKHKYRLKKYAQAVADFDKAIPLKADFIDAFMYRGLSKNELEHYAEAVLDFDKAAHVQYPEANVLYGRATAKWHLKQFEAAHKDSMWAERINFVSYDMPSASSGSTF
jgi:tetratricopeptide (TPR) repeat protein